MKKILNTFKSLNLFFIALSTLPILACSGPSQNSLTDISGFVAPVTLVDGPLGNSALSFSPQSFDFHSVSTTAGSSAKVFTVTNTSSYTVYLSTPTGITPDYTLTANTCINGFTLAPNDTCTFTVQFAPTASGPLSTAIGIPYSTTPNVSTYSSNLSVTGVGTTLSNFLGLSNVSNPTATTLQLNWLDVAGVYNYHIFKISGAFVTSLAVITVSPACVAGNCTYTVTGLSPTTAYTYRVRAMDSSGIEDQNTADKSGTTASGNLVLTGNPALALCSPMTINSRDASNNPQNLSADSTIAIAGLGSHAAIFSDSACSTPLANPIILAGTNTTQFFLKDSTAESLTLTGALALFGSASLPVTIFSPLASAFSMAPASGSLSNNAAPVVTATLPAGDVADNTTLTIYSAVGCGTSLGTAAIAGVSQNVTLTLTTNTTYSFYYTISNPGGTSACTTSGMTYTFDNIPPTLAVTTPTGGYTIHNPNQGAFTVAGTCSENTRAVTITANGTGATSATASPTCTAGAFSAALNLSSLGEGAVSITATQSDAAGNSTTTSAVNGAKTTCQNSTTVVTALGNTTYNIPVSCVYAQIKVWGAGGGGGGAEGPTTGFGGSGGGGAFVKDALPISNYAFLTLTVGGGGVGSSGAAGGGGAATTIKNDSGVGIVWAAGGGGGGGAWNSYSGGAGGVGGGANGGVGGVGVTATGGGGGSSSANGTAGSGASGPYNGAAGAGGGVVGSVGGQGGDLVDVTHLGGAAGANANAAGGAGGNSWNYVGGGGGGGGYYPGGGGGADGDVGAGGGGGSSHSIGSSIVYTAASGVTAGGNADADYASNAGAGGAGSQTVGSNGNNGRIVIKTFFDNTAPTTPPGSFTTIGSSISTFSATWTAAVDNAGGSGIATYQVGLGTSAGIDDLFSFTHGDVGNVLSASFSNFILPVGITVYPSVRALDFNGNSALTNGTPFTTPASFKLTFSTGAGGVATTASYYLSSAIGNLVVKAVGAGGGSGGGQNVDGTLGGNGGGGGYVKDTFSTASLTSLTFNVAQAGGGAAGGYIDGAGGGGATTVKNGSGAVILWAGGGGGGGDTYDAAHRGGAGGAGGGLTGVSGSNASALNAHGGSGGTNNSNGVGGTGSGYNGVNGSGGGASGSVGGLGAGAGSSFHNGGFGFDSSGGAGGIGDGAHYGGAGGGGGYYPGGGGACDGSGGYVSAGGGGGSSYSVGTSPSYTAGSGASSGATQASDADFGTSGAGSTTQSGSTGTPGNGGMIVICNPGNTGC